jgi:hypothetical protein
MWGNRLGWTISLLIVLATAGMLLLIVRGPGRTAPTAFSSDSRHFQPLQLPAPGADVALDERSDANATYREAIELYLAERGRYDDFAAFGRIESSAVKRLAAVEKLIAASAGDNATVFADRPGEIINYDHTKPPIEALRGLGRVLVDRLALLNQRAGNQEQAQRYAGAVFILGRRLCEERLCYAELDVGLELLGKATPLLITAAEKSGQADRAVALKAFDQQRLALVREQIEPVLRVVRSIDGDVVGRHAGDMFELARRSPERMWRAEAILALGRLRFFAGGGATASDQREATRLVTELAEKDADPIVRAAAIAARDLTPEKHRMQ